MTDYNSFESITDYDSFESIDCAFSQFVDEMWDILCQENFNKVQRRCLENLDVVGGISLSVDIEKKLRMQGISQIFLRLCLDISNIGIG